MARYVRFDAPNGQSITVEVSEENAPATTEGGDVVKAGVREMAERVVTAAETTFKDAVQGIVQSQAEALVEFMRSMTHPPDELEVSFGLKAVGELSNLVIGKAGGESNYLIRMVWKKAPERK